MSVIGSIASLAGKFDKLMSSAQKPGVALNRGLQSAGRKLRRSAKASGTNGPYTKKMARFLTTGSIGTKIEKVKNFANKVSGGGYGGSTGGGGSFGGGGNPFGGGSSQGGGGGGGGGGGINVGSSISKVATVAEAALTANPVAIAQTAMMAITNGMANMQKGMGYAQKAIGSERMGAVGGAALGAAATGVEQASDPLGIGYGKIVSAPIKFGEALVESIDKLQDFAHSLHDSNMKFAEFSGAMAGVKARQDVRDIYLSRERGERRAGSAETLAGSMNRLDQAKAPFEDAFANLKAELMPLIIEPLVAILQIGNFVLEKLPDPKDAAKAAAFAAGPLGIAAWLIAKQAGGKAPKNLNDDFGDAGGMEDYGRPPRGRK